MNNKYVQLEKGIEILLNNVEPVCQYEVLQTSSAVGRIAFENIYTKMDQPPFNRSPLDGYAVRHDDVTIANQDSPVILKVNQRICAGESPQKEVGIGEAARIMTGSPIPSGATCVVRQEDTDYGEDVVSIYVSHKKNDNVCWMGEDVHLGELLAEKGQKLNAAFCAVLSAQGISTIKVYSKPRIGILSIGSELLDSHESLADSKIYDSNGIYIASQVMELGSVVTEQKIEIDCPHKILHAIEALINKSDMIITTGGVSVGQQDHMPQVGRELGAQELFQGVDMKPGAPLITLKKDGTLLAFLSGNPFAAAATFELLAKPAIRKLSGNKMTESKRLKAVVKNDFAKSSPGRRMIRAILDEGGVWMPGSGHESGVLASFIQCNCLVDIPAGSPPLQKGMEVDVLLL